MTPTLRDSSGRIRLLCALERAESRESREGASASALQCLESLWAAGELYSAFRDNKNFVCTPPQGRTHMHMAKRTLPGPNLRVRASVNERPHVA